MRQFNAHLPFQALNALDAQGIAATDADVGTAGLAPHIHSIWGTVTLYDNASVDLDYAGAINVVGWYTSFDVDKTGVLTVAPAAFTGIGYIQDFRGSTATISGEFGNYSFAEADRAEIELLGGHLNQVSVASGNVTYIADGVEFDIIEDHDGNSTFEVNGSAVTVVDYNGEDVFHFNETSYAQVQLDADGDLGSDDIYVAAGGEVILSGFDNSGGAKADHLFVEQPDGHYAEVAVTDEGYVDGTDILIASVLEPAVDSFDFLV
jgi:hypothetical protein